MAPLHPMAPILHSIHSISLHMVAMEAHGEALVHGEAGERSGHLHGSGVTMSGAGLNGLFRIASTYLGLLCTAAERRPFGDFFQKSIQDRCTRARSAGAFGDFFQKSTRALLGTFSKSPGSMALHQSSGQGALFELVARGQKDTYFCKDAPTSQYLFDTRYEPTAPHLAERRTTVPLNDARFGQVVEIEIDPFGDILTEATLEIELPTWYPPLPQGSETAPFGPPATARARITTNDAAAQTYEYVNAVGYFLFDSIQFFQDQILLQEWSGDMLYAKQQTEGSLNFGELTLQQASQQRCRLTLPLPGMQVPGDAGLPLCALSWQKYRIRATLRRLEDLIICSDPTVFKPSPWSVPSFLAHYVDGNYPFVPLAREQIAPPRITLSTVQQYVSEEVQQRLRASPMEIPYRRLFENRFTFGELDYISLDKGGVSSVTRLLDGRHPTERLLWFFRNGDTQDSNRLDDFANHYFDAATIPPHVPTAVQPYTTPYGEFYYRIKLNIAGREREDAYSPLVWNLLSSLQDERANAAHIGSMNWSTGSHATLYPAPRQPEGTVNFSTADRPTLLIELANVNAMVTGQRKAEMRVATEGWCVYVVKEGRGKPMFAA